MGSPLCSGAIPALLGQSLSQVAGAEARRVGTELTPFPLSACFPCPSTGTLPPEWGRGVVMKQGGPLLVSAADRGSGCLLRTACPGPAIVRDTISGPNLPCPSELVIAPPQPRLQASASSACCGAAGATWTLGMGGWCGLTAVRF